MASTENGQNDAVCGDITAAICVVEHSMCVNGAGLIKQSELIEKSPFYKTSGRGWCAGHELFNNWGQIKY